MKKLLFGFYILIQFVSCQPSQEIKNLSKEVRATWPEHLKLLPKIDFEATLGFTPNKDQIELGRLLFSDPILSRNNDVSYATCHLSNHGFSDGQRLSFGALGKGGATGENVGSSWGRGHLTLNRLCDHDGFQFYCDKPMNRNTLSTVNVAFRANNNEDRGLMWDGRFGKLFHTSILPIMSAREMCGVNPVPIKSNFFSKQGKLFKESVKVFFATPSDSFSGKDLEGFYSKEKLVEEIPSIRGSGEISKPTKTECLAIAIAKLRRVKKYKELFSKAFDDKSINDKNLGKALASFVSTHVSRNTKFDQFVKGKNSLNKEQLFGLAMFLSPAGKVFSFGNREVTGAGCVDCHKPPLFSDKKFLSLGVKSDSRSDLSQARLIVSKKTNITDVGSRGVKANCYIENKTADSQSGYGPDIGRAEVTGRLEDCFKFRVPTLRNVIETYPYFHHGNGLGQGGQSKNFKERSEKALLQVIDYHLKGPVNQGQINSLLGSRRYFDESFLKDSFVPIELQTFTQSKGVVFPIILDKEMKLWLLSFVAYGLQDLDSTRIGELGNDVSHPKRVPSGLKPSITRDFGTQIEEIGGD